MMTTHRNQLVKGSTDGYKSWRMGWPAQLITDSLTRAVIYEKVRHAFRQKRQEDPGDLYSRIVDHQHKLLTGSLPEKFGSTGDVLEKVSYGLVRMILLIHRDPRFVSIVDLSWNSAILIAQWADIDIDGAAAELERYSRGEDADVGPRATRRRYQEAIERLSPEWSATGRPAFGKGIRRPYPVNRLTFEMIARDGYADLPRLLATFKAFDFSRHVYHIIAAELPRLAWEGREEEISQMVDHLKADGTPARYLKPAAVFLIRNGMFKDLATREALFRVDRLPASEATFKWFFEQLQRMVPINPRRLSPDKKAWKAHPRWSNVTQKQAAEYGRRLFRRNFYEWCMVIEEFRDPDNHPLNFFMYDARYKRRYGSTC